MIDKPTAHIVQRFACYLHGWCVTLTPCLEHFSHNSYETEQITSLSKHTHLSLTLPWGSPVVCQDTAIWSALQVPWSQLVNFTITLPIEFHPQFVSLLIRESVNSLCRDGADAQYMQYLGKCHITSPQIMLKAYLSTQPSRMSAFKISKTHVVARQLNAKVCSSESAIFCILFFFLCSDHFVQQQYLKNGSNICCNFSTKMMLTTAQSSATTQCLHSFKLL